MVHLLIAGFKGNMTYSVLTTDRPYPWMLYDKFEALGNGMLDLTDIEETVEPWMSLSEIQVKYLSYDITTECVILILCINPFALRKTNIV